MRLLEIVAVRKGCFTVGSCGSCRGLAGFRKLLHIRNMYSLLKQSRDYDDGRASKSAINVRGKNA
jgi:hypothetical protein